MLVLLLEDYSCCIVMMSPEVYLKLNHLFSSCNSCLLKIVLVSRHSPFILDISVDKLWMIVELCRNIKYQFSIVAVLLSALMFNGMY